MSEKVKVLICGDVEGKFTMLFNKVQMTNNKAGPFDLLLCVGNFFGINNSEFIPYRNGIKKVPISTYILGPNKEEHAELYPKGEDKICENVYYLGKRGLYTVTGGLKIAYLSGIQAGNETHIGSFNYTLEDVIALRDICLRSYANMKGVDILLTSEWPLGVAKNVEETRTKLHEAVLPAWLACQLKPRYHISGLQGIYFERAPYRNLADTHCTCTRFIALARVGNERKDKWIYAISITPLDRMKSTELVQRTTDETECPYDLDVLDSIIHNRKLTRREEKQQYFYDIKSGAGKFKSVKRQRIEFDQSKCWFCLASESVEKHLVVTVGVKAYLAAAKGGLVNEHLLICPVEHHQNALSLDEDIREEIDKFKNAIINFYARRAHVAVFFERNYKTSHMQIQAVPVPRNLSNALRSAFQTNAQASGHDLAEIDAGMRLEDVLRKHVPYFVVELPNGQTLYAHVHGKEGFPINFAREVLASSSILSMAHRSDWKDCIQSKDIETSITHKLRKDFEPFDILS